MNSFNHPFNTELCSKRLLDEYHKYGKLIVAFDFDNTIFDFHQIGGDYSCVIELLRECAKLGFELVLFTTEEDRIKLEKKVNKTHAILQLEPNYYLSVNMSSVFTNAKKPYYNILLDDRAGLEESYNILKFVVDEAKNSLRN